MAEMKLIYGRQSHNFNHFEDAEFASCRAVATRLMGVTALKVTWRSRKNKRSSFYQIMHLDYSEYGIDDYQEFDCIPGLPDYGDKKEEMQGLWSHFTGVMGGEVVSIDAACMLRLIETALPLAKDGVDREYDTDENREFRRFALKRIAMMTDALHAAGYSSDDCSEELAMEYTSPVKLSAYETINYFLMRLVDRDFSAAAFLSSMDAGELSYNELASRGIQTLMRCDITRSDKRTDPPSDDSSYPFRCRITTLGRECYYHSTLVIWLSGNIRSKNPVVTNIKIGSIIKMSEYEAAMQISRPEYLTIFSCRDSMLDGFDSKYISPFANSNPVAVPNGWLYTAYKGSNTHVDSASYRMNDDVYGYALLSIGGELVLMSNDLRNISMLDDSVIFSLYAPFISTKGRYRIDSSVFQTLCRTQGAYFDDLVEPGDD